MSENQEVDLLRPSKAAKFLGVHYATFNRWINAGAKIRCVVTGKRRRYTREALLEFSRGREMQKLVVNQ